MAVFDAIVSFIGELLPLAICVPFAVRSGLLVFQPTSYISFFGLFWFPYHEDLPYRAIVDTLTVGFIHAMLHFMAPLFPRLLKPYRKSAAPAYPDKIDRILPKGNAALTTTWATVTVLGWLSTYAGATYSSYKYITGLAFLTFMAVGLALFAINILIAIWVFIRHYPERPPLGLVTGMMWPPFHPAYTFAIQTKNRVWKYFEGHQSGGVPIVSSSEADTHTHISRA